jgi:hypothetical protein
LASRLRCNAKEADMARTATPKTGWPGGGNRIQPAVTGKIPKPDLPDALQVAGGGGTCTPKTGWPQGGNRISPAIGGQIPRPDVPTQDLQVGG